MKHITLDCYGASQYSLNDLTTVYQILNYVGYKFGLVPIAPPHIIPYYYGRVKKDSGISAYVLLKGGHVTIHTFPFRECYFVDVFSTTDFDEKQIYDYFMETLPFDEKASNFEIINRNERTFHKNPYDTDCDFGPHLMCEIDANKEITMDYMYDFLENLVVDINMDPIIRSVVNKDKTNNPNYISGIIIIAQSHIALHYDIKNKKIFADLFSCAPFNYDEVDSKLSELGNLKSNVLVPRGTKHIYRVKSVITEDELKASTLWQTNIGIDK